MARFGYDQKGSITVLQENCMDLVFFTVPEDCLAKSLNVYMKATNNFRVICVIYKPDLTLVAATQEIVVEDGTDGWITFNFAENVPLTGGNTYWFGVWAESKAGFIYIYHENVPGYQLLSVTQISYTGVPPNPLQDTIYPIAQDRVFSIYCVYEPILGHELNVNSSPIAGVPVTINGASAGTTPTSLPLHRGFFSPNDSVASFLVFPHPLPTIFPVFGLII